MALHLWFFAVHAKVEGNVVFIEIIIGDHYQLIKMLDEQGKQEQYGDDLLQVFMLID